MHGGGSAPSCCSFTHRVAFEEGSGPRVLLKSGPGNRGRSACGPTHVARLEFPRETGLILRCAGKAGNPFQTTQGNRLSCRDQEGRRGSEEAVPGPSVFVCLFGLLDLDPNELLPFLMYSFYQLLTPHQEMGTIIL